MLKHIKIMLFLLCFVCIYGGVQGSSIINPEFEEGISGQGVPAGWKWVKNGNPKVSVEDSGRIDKCLVIEGHGGTEEGGVSQVITVEPNTEYTLKFWTKAARPGGQLVVIFGGKEKYVGNTQEWIPFTVTVDSGNKMSLDVNFVLYRRNNVFYIDGVSVTKGQTRKVFVPKGPPAVSVLNVPGNIVQNSSFEQGDPPGSAPSINKMTGWFLWEKGHLNVSVTADCVHSGHYAVAYDALAGSRGGMVQKCKLKGGKKYVLAGWYMLPGAGSVKCRLQFFGLNEEGKNHSLKFNGKSFLYVELAPGNSWKEFSGSFVAPEGTVETELILLVENGPVQIFWDDISLVESEAEVSFVPSTVSEPLFKELLGKGSPPCRNIPVWTYDLSFPSMFRRHMQKFAFRYCLDEIAREYKQHNLVVSRRYTPAYEGKQKDEIDRVFEKNNLLFYVISAKKPFPEQFSAAEKKNLWGWQLGDEEYAGYCKIPQGEEWKRIDKEVRELFGYGLYGLPENNDDSNPFRWIAFHRWVSNKMCEETKGFFLSFKSDYPGRKIISSDYRSIVPADVTALSPYLDIFTSEVFDTMRPGPVVEGGENASYKEAVAPSPNPVTVGFTAKFFSDITGKPYWAMTQMCDYFGSPTPEIITERYSQVFRNGGKGIYFLAVEWFDRELTHYRYSAPERWQTMLSIADTVTKMPPLKIPQNPKTAIFYSADSYGAFPHEKEKIEEIFAAYCLLGPMVKSWFSFISDQQIAAGAADLAKFKIVYIPRANIERQSIIDMLLSYVKNGGILVCGDPDMFAYTPKGEKNSEKRRNMSGVAISGIQYPRTGINLTQAGSFLGYSDKGLTKNKVLAVNSSAYPLRILDKSVEVLARFPNGEPAITCRRFGKGQVIFFAANPFHEEAVNDPLWVTFFRNLQRYAGVKINEKIWRFSLPVPALKKSEFTKERCLTGNYLVFRRNQPVRDLNANVGGYYSYSYTPDGIPDVAKAPGIPISFDAGNLTDRFKADERCRDVYLKKSLDSAPWVVSWNKGENPVTIRFVLDEVCDIKKVRIFYTGFLPDIKVNVKQGNKWVQESFSLQEESTPDILDKTYSVNSRGKEISLEIGKRKEEFRLIEIEVWGQTSTFGKVPNT